MELELGGLHHMTAVTANAPGNLAFYTDVLGLRLVKKTVNQDDVSAYHLFYGDEIGRPGTEVTFFDWAQIPANRPGRGEIAAMALRVPGRAALDWWAARFADLGVPHGEIAQHGDYAILPFTDPEGQRLELIADDHAAASGNQPWERSTVPAEWGIRGLGVATLSVARLEPTARILTDALGFRRTGEYPSPADPAVPVVVFETGPGGPGAIVQVVANRNLAPARLGHGGVHHIAFRTPNDEEHAGWQLRLQGLGIPVTPVIDRYYFRSLYFREPGGVLFEIATDGPGFATDEDAAHLGEGLALPPFLEPHRAEIEAGLRPLTTTAAAR